MVKLSRKSLIINGVQRDVLFKYEKDTLGTVLRRLGLTGVKIGCGSGVCGACSVLLNGKVVRSCITKLSKVEDYSKIITIEGIGTPDDLHPLQQAWITYGGVQCGFCTPGFIISAYALLSENRNPTREQIRDWFHQHRNICRCTGYKPIVDAVVEAAAVLRGEKTMDDITFHIADAESFYGSRMPRPSALAKVCGLSDYGDDVSLQMPEDTAHLAPVMAGVSHAQILSIDVSDAESMDGVYKVLTAKDVKGTNDISFPAIIPRKKGRGAPKFPVICGDVVNRRGDVVALVAADTYEHAREAAKKVKVEYKLLPSYMTILESAMPNALQLHEDVPNIYMFGPLYKGNDTAEIFESAPYVAEGSFHTQHQPHLPIEPDTFQGYWDEDGMLTIQCKTHDLYGCGAELAPAIGIDKERVRMINNSAGGSFGYSTISVVFALAGVAVMALDRPCSMTLSYEEHQHMTGKRSASWSNGRIAVGADKRIKAVEFDVALDHGAYAGTSSIVFGNLLSVPFSAYNIPNVKALARAGTSNHNFACAYRGFGAPQIYTMSESLIDMAAEKVNMDAWEFRYLNAARPGDTTINSRPFLATPYVGMLEKIKPYYDEYREQAVVARAQGRYVGVGLAMGGFNVGKGFIDHCENALELRPDGGINVFNTWQDLGQGGDIGTLTHVLKSLEALNLKPEDVRLIMNDTKLAPDSGLSAASRSHFMNGRAILDAAEQLLAAMKKPDGTYRSYDEMVAENIPTKYFGHTDETGRGLDPCQDPNTGVGSRFAEYTYGINMALVEVNVKTGKTQVLRFTSVVDIGRVGNRLSAEGQGYGGISHSIGFALQEDYDGSDRSGNMAYCGIPDIKIIPDDITLIFMENNPRPNGPYGSSGCAEVFQCSNHMAVINGIHDACGIRIYDLPAKPEKVKAAWDAMQRGEPIQPPRWFLGSDFEDELENIRANPL